MIAVRAPRRSVPAARKVVEFLRRRGSDGGTDDEITVATGLDKNTVAPARFELAKRGVILNSGRTRPTRLGTPAIVWVITSTALPGAGTEAIRHSGIVMRTLGGPVLRICAMCGASLADAPEFSHGQDVFETEGILAVERLPGAREVPCRRARRAVAR